MSNALLAIVLAGALGGIAVVLNHCYARVALIELALNEGLPPGHARSPAVAGPVPGRSASDVLEAGLHVFLSRNCHACQRLIDELDQHQPSVAAPIHIRYVDKPRPIAAEAAEKLGATLVTHQMELAEQLGADPLPFTIAIGSHSLVTRAVTPTVAQMMSTARGAGLSIS